MLTAPQLLGYYPDLQDQRTKTALALVHSRFSTNTFPSWELAHPYRYIAHNGEINTLRGNVNWMRARESQLASELFGDDLEKVLPVVRPGGSDSATFDNVLELLVLAGRTPPARGDDDGAGGVGGARRPARPPARVLRVPLVRDGAVGRAGGDQLHRRPRDRRHARPQRAAARAAGWRPRTAGSCSRRSPACSTSPPPTCCARAACSPASSSSSTSTRAASSPTRRSRRRSRRGARTASGTSEGVVRLGRPARAPGAASRASRCAPASSRSATRRRTCGCCSRRWRPRARSRSARWATTSRSRSCRTRRRRCSPTSSSCSRRSRTRRSTRSASRS